MATRNTWLVAAFLLVDIVWIVSAAPKSGLLRLETPEVWRRSPPPSSVTRKISQPLASSSVHKRWSPPEPNREKRSSPFPNLEKLSPLSGQEKLSPSVTYTEKQSPSSRPEKLLSPFPHPEKLSPSSPPAISPKKSLLTVKPSSSNRSPGSTRVTTQTPTKNKFTAPKTKWLSPSPGKLVSKSDSTNNTLALVSNGAAAGAAAGVVAGAAAGLAVVGGSQIAKPNSVSKSGFVDSSQAAVKAAAAAGAIAGASAGAVAGAAAALGTQSDAKMKSPATRPVLSVSTTRSPAIINKAPVTTSPPPTGIVEMPLGLTDSIIITPSYLPKCPEGQRPDTEGGRCREVWDR